MTEEHSDLLKSNFDRNSELSDKQLNDTSLRSDGKIISYKFDRL